MCFKKKYTGAETAHACAKLLLFIAYITSIAYGFVYLDYLKTKVYQFSKYEVKQSGQVYYQVVLLFILGELLFFPRTLLVAGSGWILRLAIGESREAILKAIPLILVAVYVSSLV